MSIIKIPRENPNRRYEFPIVLCNDIDERDKRIVDEIMQFHVNG